MMPCPSPDYDPFYPYKAGDPRCHNKYPWAVQKGEVEEERRLILDNRIKEILEDYKARVDSDEIKLNNLTNLLCLVGRAIFSKQEIPLEVALWWGKHCELDKARGEPWDKESK